MDDRFGDLIIQFTRACGIKNLNSVDVKSDQFIKEFNDWLKQRKKICSNYSFFINEIGLSFQDSDCIEVGKSINDTITQTFNTTVVTSNVDGFNLSGNNEIINAEFGVFGNVPLLLKKDENGEEFVEELSVIDYSTIMTQNPTDFLDIVNWDYMHNSGDFNIIVGIYGNKYDKDVDEKIKMLQLLRDKLNRKYRLDYCGHEDQYFYVVSSNYKSLRRIK